MSELDVGAPVRVKRLGGAMRAVVIWDRGDFVRVRFMATGKKRTIDRERIVGERARAKASKLERAPDSRQSETRASQPKTPPLRDSKYLEHVRGRPCCICAAPPPSDPHHFGSRGMGQKTDDRRTVPLCRTHHDEWHTRGTIGEQFRAEIERDFYRAQVDALLAYADRIS